MHAVRNALILAAAAAPALAAPLEPRATCSSSFTGWTITDLTFDASYIFTTPAHQNSWGNVRFNATNPAIDYQVACSASSNQLQDFFYGTQVYGCTVPEGSGGKATFTFNRASGELALNQTWYCRDDPVYPARFNAGGAATAQLDCTDSGTVITPNWTIGQIYSTRTVACKPVTLPMKADWINAVA